MRTLHRQLQAEGTRFRDEVRQLRYRLAQELLADPKTPLTEIAARLGYADLTVFSRAFRSWAGVTASEWRRNHGK
ncbi:MAG: helix-turn-helix transcriptional regulator [Gammaproteobacteria bacterium]|nr:helix-turn-helix transcriptional regulator [Gammaproteobacteria bacterium]